MSFRKFKKFLIENNIEYKQDENIKNNAISKKKSHCSDYRFSFKKDSKRERYSSVAKRIACPWRAPSTSNSSVGAALASLAQMDI